MKKDNTFKRIFGLLFKLNKGSLLIVFICLLISSLAGICASIFLQRIIDDVITPGLVYGYDYVSKTLITLIIIMATIYGIGLVSTFLHTRLMAIITHRFLHQLRISMFDCMEDLPIKYFDRNKHGDIMSTYTNDVDAIRQLISQSLPQLFNSLFTIIVLFFIMMTYSIWLTLLVLVSVFVMAKVSKKIALKSSKYFIAQQKSIAKMEGFVEEMMNGQKVIKAFCHEEKGINDFDIINEQLNLDSERANEAANILMPIVHNIGNILYVLLAVLGSLLIVLEAKNISLTGIGSLTVGIVISFLTMSRQFSQSIGNVSQQVNSVVMALAGAKRIFELIDQEKEVDNGYVTLVNAIIDGDGNIQETKERTGKWAWKHPHGDGTLTYTELKGDIRMFDVDFGYYEDKIVLHDVSIYAKPGQKIAFVGATGAGKTTITNLLNRFYDIADGKIRYDGININKIKKSDLRRSIGIVLQDTNLFTGTVMENIRYGRLDASDDDVIEAAKIANAYDFIMRLPNGFNTVLSQDGSNLSQGQRQLLSIARAAIADAPVMILDEATSSIDTRTEILVQRGTDKLMEGRTVFVIAHRLSTVQNANAIMVLDHGHIIERGDHDDLIKQHGTYYSLYTGAFELE